MSTGCSSAMVRNEPHGAQVAEHTTATFMGRQPAERMGELMSLMDVAVVPHHFVPGIFYLSPLKIIESAAAGCAVVAATREISPGSSMTVAPALSSPTPI